MFRFLYSPLMREGVAARPKVQKGRWSGTGATTGRVSKLTCWSDNSPLLLNREEPYRRPVRLSRTARRLQLEWEQNGQHHN